MFSTAKSEGMDPDLFDSLVKGLEEAIAFQQGNPLKGTREHRFERLPDGSVQRSGSVIEY